MSDLSTMSTEDLLRLYGGQPSSNLSSMSNEELLKLWKDSTPSPDENMGGTLPFFGMDTKIPIPKTVEAGLVKAGDMTTRIGHGIQQGYDWLRGRDNPQLAAKVTENQRIISPLEQAYPISTALGSALPAMAVPVGLGGSVVSALTKAALAGAVPGALEYGSGNERAARAGLGAAGGVVGGIAGIGLGRLINPVRGAGPEAIQSMADAARKFDVPLTAGQATGSKPLQYLESALTQLPGSSGRMADVSKAQQAAINKATAARMGVASDAVTPETVRSALSASGGKIGTETSKFPVVLDDALLNDLAAVESRYMKRLPSQQRPIVQTYIDEILSHDGAIPGDIYQGIRSDLGTDAMGATKGSFKNALMGIQSALDNSFARSADQATNDALSVARQNYTNAKLLKRTATATGDVSTRRVATAGAGAKGDLGDLAAFLGKIPPLPDSGTAQRSFWMNLLTKSPLESFTPANLLAMTGAPYAAASAVTRQPTKHWLTNGLLSVDPELEKLLIRSGGLLGIAGSNAR